MHIRTFAFHAGVAVLAATVFAMTSVDVGAQAPVTPAKAAPVPRMPDGKPNMQGFWVIDPAVNITNVIEEHPTGFGITKTKRAIIDPPDGKLPYQPWALAERDRRRLAENAYEDPEGKCALAGVPHQMYVLFPVLMFLQPPGAFLAIFEYVHAYRHIDMTRTTHYPEAIRMWDGDSIGRWDGDTLVIDTTNLNGKPWLELSGDFVSEHAHVVERLTMPDSERIDYEARIDDPTVFTKPWTLAYSYFRGREFTELFESNCHETNVDLIHTRTLYERAHPPEKKPAN